MGYEKYICNVVSPSLERQAQFLEMPPTVRMKSFPDSFSHRPNMRFVMDQGPIGSCVGCSGSAVYSFSQSDPSKALLSAMCIYKGGKRFDSFTGEAYSGTTIIGALEALKSEGCCSEALWPYEGKEDCQPLDERLAKIDSGNRKLSQYRQIQITDTDTMRTVLMEDPLWMAFSVCESFFKTDKTGVVKEEGYLESKNVGGHAVAIIGWKFIGDKLYWECQNSWGSGFGDNGFFFIPHSLLSKICLGGVAYCTLCSPAVDPTPTPVIQLSWWKKLLKKLKDALKI